MIRRGGFAPWVLSLLAACAAPEQSAPAWQPVLEIESNPASAGFGELRLAGPPQDGEWSAAERLALEERVLARQSELLEAVAVWTGEVATPEDECRHPTEQPAVLGRVEATPRGLIFEPRFPWVAGLSYTACLDGPRMAAILGSAEGSDVRVQSRAFSLPEPEASRPQVAGVWPDVDEVPANLLRFYVHFDQPMQRRGVADHVRLLDAEGGAIVEPFVEIPDGLWGPEGRRLTLFLHPGRIKRGVGPRQALGPVLRRGQMVTLEVDGRIESAAGAALEEPSRVSYRVVDDDTSLPDPERWALAPPSAPGTPLTVDFIEPLDRAQLATAIRVLRDGSVVAGRTWVEDGGRTWHFTPAEGWRAGTYELEVDRGLEDLAGNTLDRPFDVATAEGLLDAGSEVVAASTPRGELIRLQFAVDSERR